MITKQGSGVPTIPVSADHRNGDWIDTDIYEGELYQDTDTGMIYSRTGSTIYAVGSTASYKVYRALISQASTNAPTAKVLENTLSGTPTFGYTSAGNYYMTLTGEFTADKTYVIADNFPKGGFLQIYRDDVDTISLRSYNTSLAATNGILEDVTIEIKVYA
jgi:hypothetical protein